MVSGGIEKLSEGNDASIIGMAMAIVGSVGSDGSGIAIGGMLNDRLGNPASGIVIEIEIVGIEGSEGSGTVIGGMLKLGNEHAVTLRP